MVATRLARPRRARRSRRAALACLSCLAAVSAQPARRPPPADTAPSPAESDARSPDDLLRVFYASNSAGDWPRLRSLFLPGARLVIVGRDAPGAGRWFSKTVDEFVADRARDGSRVRERELGRRELRYGAVVHAWSAYELRGGADPVAVTRGVNSFQLARAEGRWRIAHLLWTDERFAGPVPRELLAPSPREPAPAEPAPDDSARVALVRAELRALIAEVNAALRRRDRAALERHFAEEYLWVHANGYVNDRATHLTEELSVDSVAPLPATLAPPEELRVYGAVAVLRRPFRSAVALHRGRPAVATWIFARRDGRWRIVQQQSTMLQPARAVVPVAAALLDALTGDYGESGRVTVRVRREGAGLEWRGVPTLTPPRLLLPASDSTFFDKLGAEYTFVRGRDGRVGAVVVQAPDGRVLRRARMP